MTNLSRRSVLAAAAAGGVAMAATAVQAQTGQAMPMPRRPGAGGTDPGPRNALRDQQNPDIYAPPGTDHGTLPNLRFSFSDAHMRLKPSGWTRQVTVHELGVSKTIAGVKIRLKDRTV